MFVANHFLHLFDFSNYFFKTIAFLKYTGFSMNKKISHRVPTIQSFYIYIVINLWKENLKNMLQTRFLKA